MKMKVIVATKNYTTGCTCTFLYYMGQDVWNYWW